MLSPTGAPSFDVHGVRHLSEYKGGRGTERGEERARARERERASERVRAMKKKGGRDIHTKMLQSRPSRDTPKKRPKIRPKKLGGQRLSPVTLSRASITSESPDTKATEPTETKVNAPVETLKKKKVMGGAPLGA